MSNIQLQETHEVPAYVPYAEYERVVRECDSLRSKIEEIEADYHKNSEQIQRECAYLRSQVREMDGRDAWRKTLDTVPASAMSPSQKDTTNRLLCYIDTHPELKNADGYTHLETWQLAQNGEQSIGTLRDNINYVSTVIENGKPDRAAIIPLFHKKIVHIPEPLPGKPYHYREETYIKALDLAHHPEGYEDNCTALKKWGGAGRGQGRKKSCEKCGRDLQTKNTVISTQIATFCPRCNIRHIYPEQLVATPQIPTDDLPSEDGEAVNQVDFQVSENGEATNQLDVVTTIDIRNQVDFQPIEQDEPSTPPVVRSDLEIEQDAAQLLLDIAGEHTSHIEMIPQEQKYTTVPYALNQNDMLAHLRGKRTRGTKLYYADGTLRGMMFDGDNLQDWQHVKDAATLLQAIGITMLLEPSPAPIGSKHEGGGHGLIVFAEHVDAYSAFQTVYQYTGDLLQSVEQWPSLRGGGNNVRLPGGKYVTPTSQTWCKLYDADGLELSHDGTGAARVLLDYQTPIDCINQYERPSVEPPVKITPKPQTSVGGYLEKDVAPYVIADFNDTTSWETLIAQCGGTNRQGKFSAIWRGDRTPNVAINRKTDLAKDFSSNAWLDCPMDKYQVYCLIEGGSDWQAFRKRDLVQRCRNYREQAIAS